MMELDLSGTIAHTELVVLYMPSTYYSIYIFTYFRSLAFKACVSETSNLRRASFFGL